MHLERENLYILFGYFCILTATSVDFDVGFHLSYLQHAGSFLYRCNNKTEQVSSLYLQAFVYVLSISSQFQIILHVAVAAVTLAFCLLLLFLRFRSEVLDHNSLVNRQSRLRLGKSTLFSFSIKYTVVGGDFTVDISLDYAGRYKASCPI